MNENTVSIKDCEACGCSFTPTTSNQKYCPDCGSHGLRIRHRYDRQVAISKKYEQLYDPKVYTRICKICGKEFQTTYNRDICSDKCSRLHSKQKLTCAYCHRPLTETYEEQGLEIPDSEIHKRIHFCNNTCQEAYETELYPPRICTNCGKTYRNKNIKFCCQTCQREYNHKHHKSSKPKLILPKTKSKTLYTCVICGTKCEHPAYFRCPELSAKTARSQPICSKECLDIFNKSIQTKKKKDRQKRLSEYIKTNGMCGICTTPYSDCERMQSDFRIIPNGARYIDSKIQICPKFQTKFK